MTNERKIALITGASGGLGLDFARLAAADGYDVILVARSLERLNEASRELEQFYGARTHIFPTDLSETGAADRLVSDIQSAGLQVDCLINNAGFGDTGYFADRPWQMADEMIMLNMHALSRLTHAFAQGMKQRGHGYILNMGSNGSFQPAPNMAVYAATKAYVLHFSEGLHYELKPHGVKVTCSCPGPTATAFHDRAGTHSSLIYRLGLLKSEKVAEEAWMAMKKGRQYIVHGWANKLFALTVNFTPRGMVPYFSHLFIKDR